MSYLTYGLHNNETIFGEHSKMTIMAHILTIQFLIKGNINCLVSSEIAMASIYLMFNSVS